MKRTILRAQILCPECDEPEGQVLNTRGTVDNTIWRRRRCSNGHVFSTIEAVADDLQRGPPGTWNESDDRKLLALREAGYTFKEIGQELGRPRTTVASHHQRLTQERNSGK